MTALVYTAIAVLVAHRAGWLDRWIWFILEKEARKVCNGAQVTIGSFTVDWSELLQGKITLHASNVVIHTPKRHEWQWDSPLIARVGKASVECNALITIFHAVFLRREVPVEAYTIIVADVQIFVERRQSVINVYLLNPTLQLPPPPCSQNVNNDANASIESKVGDDVASLKPEAPITGVPPRPDTYEYHNTYPESARSSPRDKASTTFFDTKSPIITLREDTLSNRDNHNHNQQAKVLVNEMLQAVQKLGGAAARGQLQTAIKRQGLELVGRLKEFREQENLEEGIRVMQQVGKVARESLQSAPRLILPKPDAAREMEKKVVYIRIGRIIAKDLRIFTKDSWINEASTREDFVDSTSAIAIRLQSKSNSSSILLASSKDINGCESSANMIDINTKHNGSWNKPIYIENLVLGSSELCPPMSMKDVHNLPVIFQSVEKIMEVVWRRVLTEIAKSNTGRLFSTAMGEVLSVMVSNPHGSISLTTIGASPTGGASSTT